MVVMQGGLVAAVGLLQATCHPPVQVTALPHALVSVYVRCLLWLPCVPNIMVRLIAEATGNVHTTQEIWMTPVKN